MKTTHYIISSIWAIFNSSPHISQIYHKQVYTLKIGPLYIVKQISSAAKGEFLSPSSRTLSLELYPRCVVSLTFWPGQCWPWDEVPYWPPDRPFMALWTLNSRIFIMSPLGMQLYNSMEYFQSELKTRKITPIKLLLINILKHYNIKNSIAAFRLLSLEILKSTSINLPPDNGNCTC